MSEPVPWPVAGTPGGQVMTDHGAVPGCVRGTCTHARLAHDVWDVADPVPRCGADGCGCGQLTRAIVRDFPGYYLTGPGRARASEIQCEHKYKLTDPCPSCAADEPPCSSALAELLYQVTIELPVDDHVVRRLAEQIAASDPGQFSGHEVAAIVRATIELCHRVGVDPGEAGPHVMETVLGRRQLATEAGT